MNHIKYIIGILFMLIFLCSEAQDLGFNDGKITPESNRLQAKIMGKVFHLNASTNSNFLYPANWVNSTVVLSNGDIYENIKVRLHAKFDELIAFNENHSSLYLIEKEQVKSFSMEVDGTTKQMVKMNKPGENTTSDQYFEQLYSGTQSLLSFRYIYEKKVGPYTDEMGIMRDVEFSLRANYYRYTEKDGYHKINLRRRSLYASFPEHKKEIKKILRKFNLMLKTEQELIKAFTILDEQGILD